MGSSPHTPPAVGGKKVQPVRARVAIAGGGEALTATLEGLAHRRPPGKTLVITNGPNWMASMPRHHELGQTRAGLSTRDPAALSDPRRHMTADEYQRELADRQMSAVFAFGDDELDVLESSVVSVSKGQGQDVRARCADGTVVACRQLVLCTGVGPEKPLAASGVKILNAPTGARQMAHEVTTALGAVSRRAGEFAGKTVLVFGGWATAAWVVEVLLGVAADLVWVARPDRGFAGANPNGRNNDTMDRTEHCRVLANVTSVRYLGDAGARPSGPGLLVTLDVGGTKREVRADAMVASVGADALAPTGVKSVLPPDIYERLRPIVSPTGGLVAATRDRAVIVTTTPLVLDPFWSGLVKEHTFPHLAPENHVKDGLRVARLSGRAAATLIGGSKT